MWTGQHKWESRSSYAHMHCLKLSGSPPQCNQLLLNSSDQSNNWWLSNGTEGCGCLVYSSLCVLACALFQLRNSCHVLYFTVWGTTAKTNQKAKAQPCCCCHDEPVKHCLYGGTDVPKRWGIPQVSESGGIHLSLMIVDGHFLDWGTTQMWLSLPTADVLSTIVKRWMLMDVDKLSSCSRFYDSVVGFTGQKTQPKA